jgi:hypothetical protein
MRRNTGVGPDCGLEFEYSGVSRRAGRLLLQLGAEIPISRAEQVYAILLTKHRGSNVTTVEGVSFLRS